MHAIVVRLLGKFGGMSALGQLDASFLALRAATSFSLNDSLLPRSLALRASENEGVGYGLDCLRSSVLSGGPATVVGLGGSISAGSSYSVRYGGSGAWLYHAKVAQALRAISKASISHHNGALPATGPAFFEHCVEGQLGSVHARGVVPRLVLVEFGVNTDGQPAAFERLLRKLLSIKPPLALLVVNTHVWTLRGERRKCWRGANRSPIRMTEPEQLAAQTWEDRFNFGDEDAIAKLCRHYGVPLVSMRSALLEAVKANHGPRHEGSLELRHFMIDCKHPSGQGHTYLAQMVLARLLRDVPRLGGEFGAASAAVASTATPCNDGHTAALGHSLPPPLHEDGLPQGASRCVNGAQLQNLTAIATRGFQFSDEGRGKLGWIGRRAGDELSFCLVSPADERGDAAESGDSRAVVTTQSRGVGGTSRSGKHKKRHAALRHADSTPFRRRDWGRPGRSLDEGSDSRAQCIDIGPRGATVEVAREHCRQRRVFCGQSKFPKLLKQCPASCGMCAPVLNSAEQSGAQRSGTAAVHDGDEFSSSSLLPSSVVGLWIGYLESYEHMGRATVSCAGSCTCAESDIDAHSAQTPRVSITAVRRIALRLHALDNAGVPRTSTTKSTSSCCRLTLRIQNQSSSGEHKFKLLALLMAKAKESDNWQPPGVKVGASWALDMMHHVA